MAVESTAYVRATSACVVVPFLYFSLFAIFVYSLLGRGIAKSLGVALSRRREGSG